MANNSCDHNHINIKRLQNTSMSELVTENWIGQGAGSEKVRYLVSETNY